ncbi:MAG: hypothetical protein F4X75_24025 [Gemmatimonadetes bacterium]|nr:hypothetical protein [Gemmatimonadota bacterium]
MSDMMRMAVVGVGWAGSHHVEGARELGRKVVVTCLADRDPDHLQAKAEEFGIDKTYTDLDEAAMRSSGITGYSKRRRSRV